VTPIKPTLQSSNIQRFAEMIQLFLIRITWKINIEKLGKSFSLTDEV